MTQTNPFSSPYMKPEVSARLMDRDMVANAYANNTLKGAAREMGAGFVSFARALRYHGIEIRKRGEKPPGLRLTRGDVEKAILRAYAKSDRCPPSCPGREWCLDGECTLGQYL